MKPIGKSWDSPEQVIEHLKTNNISEVTVTSRFLEGFRNVVRKQTLDLVVGILEYHQEGYSLNKNICCASSIRDLKKEIQEIIDKESK